MHSHLLKQNIPQIKIQLNKLLNLQFRKVDDRINTRTNQHFNKTTWSMKLRRGRRWLTRKHTQVSMKSNRLGLLRQTHFLRGLFELTAIWTLAFNGSDSSLRSRGGALPETETTAFISVEFRETHQRRTMSRLGTNPNWKTPQSHSNKKKSEEKTKSSNVIEEFGGIRSTKVSMGKWVW